MVVQVLTKLCVDNLLCEPFGAFPTLDYATDIGLHGLILRMINKIVMAMN
jgi:hypothetical protein